MTGTAKRCLIKVIGNARLNKNEISTVPGKVECTLNSRSLIYEELKAKVIIPRLFLRRRISPLSGCISCELYIDENSNFDNFSKDFCTQ